MTGSRLHGIDLVVFDLDGTLVDSSRDLTAAVNHARTRLGFPPFEVATVIGFVGDGLGRLIERAFPEASRRELASAEAAFQSYYASRSTLHTRPFPGVVPLLEALSDHRLAVVTNKADRFVRPLLQQLGIGDRFEVVVGERPDIPRKPAPEMVLHVLSETGVPAERAVMVGDGPQDLAAGAAAGVRTCWVSWGYGHGDTPEGVVPDLRIDHPRELLDALR